MRRSLGHPDVFVVVEVVDQKEPNKLIMDKNQSVDSVRTETHIAIEWQSANRERPFSRENAGWPKSTSRA